MTGFTLPVEQVRATHPRSLGGSWDKSAKRLSLSNGRAMTLQKSIACVRASRELIMAICVRFLTVTVLIAGLEVAPAAHAAHWHGGGNYHHSGGGNVAGAAIVGGIIGLGIGAAIASSGYYAAPPPPVYYGAPPAYYYSPPPPVYYGY